MINSLNSKSNETFWLFISYIGTSESLAILEYLVPGWQVRVMVTNAMMSYMYYMWAMPVYLCNITSPHGYFEYA